MMSNTTTKIAFTGAHGVGKTTLLNEIYNRIQSNDCSVALTPEVPRIICEMASDPTFFRRGNNNIIKQLLVMQGQMNIEFKIGLSKPDIIICDRSLLDHWAYTKYFFSSILENEDLIFHYESMVADYCASYEMIFYVPIEFPPVDDGTREDDITFQAGIDKMIKDVLTKHHLKTIEVAGDLDSRVNVVEQWLNNQ